MPGTDSVETAALALGELALPFLPELPARGPGAEMVGRSAALLIDLPAEIVPSGWRLAAHPGRDARRARDFLARDLDALEQAADGYVGPLKVQSAGPWTLAATLELPSGHRVVSDRGAVRDLAASLHEGLRTHVADIRARIPGAELVVQYDEPMLPTVLAGRVPTPSGYGTVRSVDVPDATTTLASVLELGEGLTTVVHCCAPEVPIALIAEAGAGAVSFDASLVTPAGLDALGEAQDGGLGLWPGVVPGTDASIDLATARTALRAVTDPLGLSGTALGELVVSPTCGLAGASPAYARRAFAVLTDLARWLTDPE